MSYINHFKRLIAKYSFPLEVGRDIGPKPHQVDVPYHFAYVPLKRIGRFYLFHTREDRLDFAARYRLPLRIPRLWPPEKFR